MSLAPTPACLVRGDVLNGHRGRTTTLQHHWLLNSCFLLSTQALACSSRERQDNFCLWQLGISFVMIIPLLALDFPCVPLQNEMLEEGQEYAVMLYTWRSCSRAIPQVPCCPNLPSQTTPPHQQSHPPSQATPHTASSAQSDHAPYHQPLPTWTDHAHQPHPARPCPCHQPSLTPSWLLPLSPLGPQL